MFMVPPAAVVQRVVVLHSPWKTGKLRAIVAGNRSARQAESRNRVVGDGRGIVEEVVLLVADADVEQHGRGE
jgi:hypothetical protein